MVDNVTTNAGSGGAVFATDDIAGVQHTRVKVQFGVDGSATDASATDPLPVTTASLPLPSGASTEATLSALNTKVPAQGQATMAAGTATLTFNAAPGATGDSFFNIYPSVLLKNNAGNKHFLSMMGCGT